MSKKVLSADNQQERTRFYLNPWYITGFTEGEGTFHIAFCKDTKMKVSLKIIPEFHINQSYLRMEILEEIKKYFGCGYIKANHQKNLRDKTYVYVVRNRSELLKKIIPFFKRYQLQSDKRKSFELFDKVVQMINEGEHRNRLGAKRIIDLAYRMNIGGKYRLRPKTELFKILSSSETIR